MLKIFWHATPWSIEELEACQLSVFPVVPLDLMLDLSDEAGGVPRYVLQIPASIIRQENPNFKDQPVILNNQDVIKKRSLERVEEALSEISDFRKLIQCFSKNLPYSSVARHFLPRTMPLVIFLIKSRKNWRMVDGAIYF